MARSSPGHPRAVDSNGETPVAGSVDPVVEDGTHQGYSDAAISFDGQEPACSAQLSPGKIAHAHHQAISRSVLDDAMPLKRPSIKPPDFNKGYVLAPAERFATDRFTRRPVNPTPLHLDDQPRRLQDEAPLQPSRDPNTKAYFPALDSGSSESTVGRKCSESKPSDCSEGKPALMRPHLGGNIVSKHHESTTQKASPLLREPPFPDSSPAYVAIPPFPAEDENIWTANPPSPTAEPARDQASVLPQADRNESVVRPEQHVSGHILRVRHKDDTMSCHPLPKHSQHDHSWESEEVRGDGRNRRNSLPSTSSRNCAVQSTQNKMVNRPLRDTAQGKHAKLPRQTRPHSRSSNVSKRRFMPDASHRVARDVDRVENRSMSGSLASSPMLRQRRVNISHEFTTEMAEVINQFTYQQNATMEDQKAQYHRYIKRLKRELAEEAGVVERQRAQIEAQSKEIKDLQSSEEQLAGQLRDMEAKATASEDRVRKLEEKYQIYKAHLNSAIQEQQDLYNRSKKHWQETIEQIRATEKARNTETEMAIRKADAIREQMTERVRQTIAQNKSEASERKYFGSDMGTKDH